MNDNAINIDNITDDMYWLSLDTVLRFTASLARADTKDNTRRFFHKEIERDAKYVDVYRTTSIKREINYYASLVNISNQESFTMIRIQDIIIIRQSLEKIQSWFTKGIYVIDNGRLIIKTKVRPINITNLAQFKSLKFEPTIIRYNEETVPGVRITFLPSNVFSDITVDKFMGFVYLINTIDMHMIALTMINYIEAPPYGTNLYSYKTNNIESTVGEGVTKSPVRHVSGIQKESYFNKIRRLEE